METHLEAGSMGLDNCMGEVRKTEKWRKKARMNPNPSFLPE